ncbi:MAG: DEAD/DEAH box helicase family protein [Candidatus Micrarchaeaceae archaeon]
MDVGLLVLQNFLAGMGDDFRGSVGSKFSYFKTLYDHQVKALENVYKLLRFYYQDLLADKQSLFDAVYKGKTREYITMKIEDQDIVEYLGLENDTIHFSKLANRASFWMATGSGKTLIIVKLIELLKQLMDNEEIPKKDILFLTARNDLLDQFIKHVDEYNSSNSLRINLISLNEFTRAKNNQMLDTKNRIDIFYYRSDLITNEDGDKRIDFKNVYNNGNWYLILDEAHKGEKIGSKAQAIFTILTEKGFMFNFSATFTEDIDHWTCAYNFNLEKFIQDGYGKDLYISKHDTKSLKNKEDFTQEKKKEIVLRTLILLTALKQIKQEIGDYYHNPMFLVLVNSVDTENSDLKVFFKVLEDIANNPITDDILNKVKDDLKQELRDAKTEFREQGINNIIIDKIENIKEKDILLYAFNSENHGKIEVKVLPDNKQEMALSLKASSKPFALIKIGDITNWIQEKLKGYEIIESFDNESLFTQINSDNSDINILLGSRSFYEGWDSDRPNIMLFMNIGQGKNAKKFVLQSIGRGVRVSPIKNRREIWDCLENEINNDDFNKFKDHAQALETLYVYGTSTDNLKIIVKALKEIESEDKTGNKVLHMPLHKEKKPLWGIVKLKISKDDMSILEKYMQCIPDEVFLVKYEVRPSVLKSIRESLGKQDEYYDTNTDIRLGKPDIIVKRVINYYLAS